MTSTYIALATTTLSSASSSVTFSSIPATYRDLVLVTSYTVSVNAALLGSVNGTGSTDLNMVRMFGSSAGAGSDSFSNNNTFGEPLTSDLRNSEVIQFMDYSATDKHKTILNRHNGIGRVQAFAYRWARTAAINSFALSVNVGTFNAGSTFSLYGVN